MLALALAGSGVKVILGFVVVVLLISWFSNPPFGLGNAPAQPIAFPHTVHAGTDFLLDAGGKILWLDLEYSRGTRRELQNAILYYLQ